MTQAAATSPPDGRQAPAPGSTQEPRAEPRREGKAAPATPQTPSAGTGVLRQPGAPPRDVPLMSIQRDEVRTEVGAVTQETGVADVLLGSIGLVAAMLAASLVLGALLGAVLVFLKHRLGWGGGPDKDAAEHISLRER